MNQPHNDPQHDNEVFQNEWKNAILKSSNTESFDIDCLSVTTEKNLGTKALLC